MKTRMPPSIAKAAYRILLTALLLLYLAFAFPIAGYFTFDYFTHDLISACGRTAEGFPKSPCLLHGIDIANVSSNYLGTMFFLGIFHPFIALKAIPAIIPYYFLIPWILLIVFFRYQSRQVASNA